MRIGQKLSGAFALYIVLLAAVLVYHVATVRGSVETGHALKAISARHRVIADDQLGRVVEMSNTAEKYLVTRDSGYLDRFVDLGDSFGAELRRLDALPLSAGERRQLVPLLAQWNRVERALGAIKGDRSSSAATVLAELEPALDGIASGMPPLAAAAQEAMTGELAVSERTARDAERLAWAAAVVALALTALLSVLLMRSIVRPLRRLAGGTREISAGRLGFRLDDGGHDELAEVARDFNAMAARLQELDRLKRDFVSNVSHDLKTPLSSMQEATQLLLDGLPGPLQNKQRRLLELSHESGRRLSAMIAKLLDLSRLESSGTPALELTDVAIVLGRAVDRVNDTRPARAPRIQVAGLDGLVLVRGDVDKLTQVVDNLLENAIKFSPADGAIRVALRVVDREVTITVADEGPGIPAAEQERVFERFHQTEAGRSSRSRGAGLGLAICRHIVSLHGGTIFARDNAPRGTVLTVVLPLATGARAEVTELAGAAA
ncbi:MAG: ATP-binding protein [Gemmatimonadaceae bacterium]